MMAARYGFMAISTIPVKLVKPSSRPKLAALCASGASVMRLLPTPPLRVRAGQESERR